MACRPYTCGAVPYEWATTDGVREARGGAGRSSLFLLSYSKKHVFHPGVNRVWVPVRDHVPRCGQTNPHGTDVLLSLWKRSHAGPQQQEASIAGHVSAFTSDKDAMIGDGH